MRRQSEDLGALRSIVGRELREPVRESARWLASEIAHIHGDSVLGILFYGSCLRNESDEGVFDFWVIVDDYRTAYSNPALALANRIAPPNVFFVERDHDGKTLRTKFGVIDRRAFAKGASLGAWHPYIWARFAQPTRALSVRDDEAWSFLEESLSEAIIAMVGRLTSQLPSRGGLLRFSLAAFWQEAFRRTYDSERRPEAEESIRGLYHADADRYDAVGFLAMRELAARGHFVSATEHPRSFSVELTRPTRSVQRLRWQLMRPYSRAIGLVRLLKTAFTFGDWVPYVLFKIEWHTGRHIELTKLQRRHPLIFGWPIILPLLLRRNLR
ncbi:MAG: hypothetical protein CL908_25415 [Deltaproteobacteria bacterium]|nr:hypothetical protein [Deltaproteobacteria bacterium]